jgi:hypothetical protein
MPSPPRIRATARLCIAARAIEQTLEDMKDEPHGAIHPTVYLDALMGVHQYADELMDPYDVASVIETLEETRTHEGAVPWSEKGYEGALKALVDVREHAREDEEVPGA